MRYTITEQGPRGTVAPIAQSEDLALASKVFTIAMETGEAGWRYTLRDRGVILTERTAKG